MKQLTILIYILYIIFARAGHSFNYNGINIEQSYHHFLHTFKMYKRICSIKENNVVYPRYDGYNYDKDKFLPWTMDFGAVHKFFNISMHDDTSVHSMSRPICKSVEDVTKSIGLPLDQQTCSMPWFTSNDICLLLSHFSGIVFQGDSLTRHVTQTLLILLRNDWRYGSIPFDATDDIYEMCGCDGQFSESLACRDQILPPNHIYDFRHRGSCSATYNRLMKTNFHFGDADQYDEYYRYVKCDDTTKPYMFVLQGGLHYKTDAELTWNDLVFPVIRRIERDYKACRDRIILVFIGSVVVDEILEGKYPTQKRENVLKFHADMKAKFKEYRPETIFIDFYNLTLDATNRTSDGCHSMTDINIIKTTTILNVMHHALSEYNHLGNYEHINYHGDYIRRRH